MEEKQTIVALGAGSISKRVYPDGNIKRCENVKEVAQYIARILGFKTMKINERIAIKA